MSEKRRLGDEFKSRQQVMIQHAEQVQKEKRESMRNLRQEYDQQVQNKQESQRMARDSEIQAERARI